MRSGKSVLMEIIGFFCGVNGGNGGYLDKYGNPGAARLPSTSRGDYGGHCGVRAIIWQYIFVVLIFIL